jgi:hypothetical protein
MLFGSTASNRRRAVKASAQRGQAFRNPQQVKALGEDILEDQVTGQTTLRDRFHRPSDHHWVGGQVDDLELAALFIVLGTECTGQRREFGCAPKSMVLS